MMCPLFFFRETCNWLKICYTKNTKLFEIGSYTAKSPKKEMKP